MKLRDYLKQFEGLDPETEVYKREGFEDDPPMKDFGKAFKPLHYNGATNSLEKILV